MLRVVESTVVAARMTPTPQVAELLDVSVGKAVHLELVLLELAILTVDEAEVVQKVEPAFALMLGPSVVLLVVVDKLGELVVDVVVPVWGNHELVDRILHDHMSPPFRV